MIEVLRPLARDLVVGLDLSGGMLRVARATGAPLVRANALAPPFRGSFDLVTCFSALGHILPREQRAFVEAVSQCLEPGGRFVFATGEMPPPWSRSYWLSRAFNAAMHVRNAIWSPKFVMYYLTFLMPGAGALLQEAGFRVRSERGVFARPFEKLMLVEAVKG